MSPEQVSSESIYGLPRSVRLLLLLLPLTGFALFGFGLLTFLPALNESFSDSVWTTLIGLLGCGVMLSLYRAIRRTRLVLTEDGITYDGWGFRLYTPWENVVGMGQIYPYAFPLSFRAIRGLQLRQPTVLGMKVQEARQQGKAALETAWWNPVFGMAVFAGLLPTTPMLPRRNWQESELGKQLQQYAPWAFEKKG